MEPDWITGLLVGLLGGAAICLIMAAVTAHQATRRAQRRSAERRQAARTPGAYPYRLYLLPAKGQRVEDAYTVIWLCDTAETIETWIYDPPAGEYDRFEFTEDRPNGRVIGGGTFNKPLIVTGRGHAVRVVVALNHR